MEANNFWWWQKCIATDEDEGDTRQYSFSICRFYDENCDLVRRARFNHFCEHYLDFLGYYVATFALITNNSINYLVGSSYFYVNLWLGELNGTNFN